MLPPSRGNGQKKGSQPMKQFQRYQENIMAVFKGKKY